MATDAAALWSRGASQMLRMIELHVKALFESIGESFARRIVPVHVLMTDRAHRDIRCGELRQVTSRACFVSREIRPGGVVAAAMTIVAAERYVFRTRVKEC